MKISYRFLMRYHVRMRVLVIMTIIEIQKRWFAMNLSNRTIILITAILIFACAPKPVKPPVPAKMDPGEKLLRAAEQFFQAESYDKALENFRAYLRNYSDRPFAPAAVLKIGKIHLIQGDTAKAREAFTQVITQYPDSFYVLDARIEILATFYHDGKYREVIRRAAEIPEDRLMRRQGIRLYALLGDSSMALGAYEDAFFYFGSALEKAAAQEKTGFRVKLKETVGRLSQEAMLSLLDRFGKTEAGGYLLYALGVYEADRQRYDEALRLLTELTETVPDHEYVPQAKNLIDDLKMKLLYQVEKKPVYRHYTIGCMLPLSGPYEIYGNRALRGIEMALNQFSADEINPSITIVIKDTQSDLDRVLQAVAELSEENVSAIIGPITTAVPAAFEAQDREVPIITLTQRENITMIGDYVFRNFITPKMQIETIVPYAVQVLGVDRFATLYPEEPYGNTFMNLFWDEVTANGGTVVGVESYDPTHMDFADPIKKLVGLFYKVPEDLKQKSSVNLDDTSGSPGNTQRDEDEKPKAIVDFGAIFIPDAPKKAGLVIPQLAYYDVENVHLLGTNLWHSDRLIQMAGRYTQGALMSDGFIAESVSETVRNFNQKFQTIYQETPGFIEAIIYDTAMLLFQTVSRPEVGSRRLLKEELLKLKDYPGVTGLTSFDENGDAKKRLYLLRVKGEKFVEVEY